MIMRTKIFLLFLSFGLFPGISFSQTPEAPVVVSKVVEREVKKPINLVGATFPAKRSVISSEVEGVVEKVGAEEGKYVKKGEVLVKIKDEKIRLALEKLRNEKKEVSARAALYEKELSRVRDLYEKGIVSGGELDEAMAQRDSVQATLLSFESRVESAEYDLQASKITAPFNGYVTKQHTEEGQWLDVGKEVVSLVDIDTIEVVAALPERYVEDVREGMEVEVLLKSPKRIFAGKIFSVTPEAQPRTISLPVKVILDNPDHLIKSSVSAMIRVGIGEKKRIKLVPKDSIVSSPRGTIVFVVREGVAHPVPVKQINWYGGAAQIEGDLNAGENVVVRGNERLRPMQKVSIADSIEP